MSASLAGSANNWGSVGSGPQCQASCDMRSNTFDLGVKVHRNVRVAEEDVVQGSPSVGKLVCHRIPFDMSNLISSNML